ncbi:hypothetical protein KC19_4G269900 [Ceratodon purpureus]|uniref:Uncharacterized protein n=1 Tax=Ceratodon purpureus TaxID=3225 RepID=A0A8T0IGS9_CERPU|nr:hypothetical protein KC19_4G269900 [Ceratodon purpureus]
MAEMHAVSARPAHLSPATFDLLAAHFRTTSDLDRAKLLLPALQRDYHDALHKPHLRALLLDRIAHGATNADHFVACLGDLALKADSSSSVPDHHRPSFPSSRADAVHDIAALVDELVRVERCRAYVKHLSHLDMLVGDLEDAVAIIAMGFAERRFKVGGGGAVRDSGQNLLEALTRLQSVEESVSSTSQSGPDAAQLVRAVELRVDRAASTIRSATVDEFSSFLQVMGWPPPLIAGDREFRDDSQRMNPLLQASESSLSRLRLYFRVLSMLQALQQKRAHDRLKKDSLEIQENARDSTGINADKFLTYEPLWAMQELVCPFATQAIYHFKKWVQKPELVCQLAHTMCQGYVDTVDVLLQPVISDSGLTDYSAREEWVLCFSLMVQNFFKSTVFPGLAEDLEGSEASRPATSLWLHIVDQILAFDTKMSSLLVQNTGIVQFRPGSDSIIQHRIFEKSKKGLGVVHVFAERPHWLDVWANIEYADAWEKLMAFLNTEEAWAVKESNRTILEKGIPSGATAVLAAMWSAIDRCRTLPEVKLRLAFVRKGAVPIAEKYHDELLWRCEHVRGFTGRIADLDVRKVALCINAARHCEHKLQEWSEDYFFLELRLEEVCQNIEHDLEFDLHGVDSEDVGISGLEGTIFDDVINLYAGFCKEQITNLLSVITGKFERYCKSYSSSMASWFVERFDSVNGVSERYPSQESSGAGLDDSKPSSISNTLVEALFMLQQELKVLSDSLQDDDFTEFCWNLMMKLDEVFVTTVFPSSGRFSRSGTQQLMVDATGLFQVFQPYCVRPSSIFKRLTGAIKDARRTVQ